MIGAAAKTAKSTISRIRIAWRRRPRSDPVLVDGAAAVCSLSVLALPRIDETVTARDDRETSVFGDSRVHLHLAVARTRHHFSRTTRSLADLCMVERLGDMLAVKIACLLHRQFPQFQAAIHARRSAAGRKEDFAGELPVVFRLDPCAGRILR